MTMRQLRAATASDPMLSKVFRYVRDKWPGVTPESLRPFSDRRNELTVEEGCILWGFRVVIPKKLREKLLQELHKDHVSSQELHVVARSRQGLGEFSQSMPSMSSSKESSPSGTLAPMGVAI